MTRAAGGRWLMRIEDLDRDRVRAADGVEERQLADLRALGLHWDGDPVRQSERLDLYRDAVARLPTYECFCTRREIAEAASAPHDGYRAYAGTCRDLTATEREAKRRTRPPAIRVDARGAGFTVTDDHAGEVTAVVDDFVLVRGDGQFAYNLAVVVDDLAMGVTHITRGTDLLTSAPRQAWLTERLGGWPRRTRTSGSWSTGGATGSPSGTAPSRFVNSGSRRARCSPSCAAHSGSVRAVRRKKRWPPCPAISASSRVSRSLRTRRPRPRSR
nr:glutamate--tRNA ligase family protein [Tessaracoccus coleopterorum]